MSTTHRHMTDFSFFLKERVETELIIRILFYLSLRLLISSALDLTDLFLTRTVWWRGSENFVNQETLKESHCQNSLKSIIREYILIVRRKESSNESKTMHWNQLACKWSWWWGMSQEEMSLRVYWKECRVQKKKNRTSYDKKSGSSISKSEQKCLFERGMENRGQDEEEEEMFLGSKFFR